MTANPNPVMQNSQTLRSHLLFSLALLGALATATAQTTPAQSATARPVDETVLLPEFTTQEDRETGYTATNSVSATKIATELKNIPVSIDIVTERLIKDYGMTEINDMVALSSGVTSSQRQPMGGTESYTIRGFVTYYFARNGNSNLKTFDSANIARVEVVNGPASVLYGQMEPGGVANFVTKQPSVRPSTEVKLDVGSWDYYRAELNTTGPLNRSGTFTYRIDASYLDRNGYRDFDRQKKKFSAPAIRWQPRKGTSVTLDLEAVDMDINGTANWPRYYNRAVTPNVYKPADMIPWTWNGMGPGTGSHRGMVTYSGTFEHALTSRIVIRNVAGVSSSRGNQFDPQGGNINVVATTPPGQLPFSRALSGAYSNNWNFANTFSIAGRLDFSPRHYTRAVAGWEYNAFRQNVQNRASGIAGGVGVATPAIWDLANPATWDRTVPPLVDARLTANTGTESEDNKFYFIDALALFNERLMFLAGVNYSKVDNLARNFLTNTNVRTKRDRTTPQAGAVYRVTKALGLYVNYSEAYRQILTLRNNADRTLTPFDPLLAKGWDFGFKFDFGDGRYSGQATAFSAKDENGRQSFIGSDALGTFPYETQVGENRSDGAEFRLSANVAKGFQLVGGYTYTDSRVTKNPSNPAIVGRAQARSPKDAFRVTTSYRFSRGPFSGLSTGATVFYQGPSKAFETNLPFEFRQGTRTCVVSARAGYSAKLFGKPISYGLLVSNLFNQRYFPSSVSPADPTSYRFSIEYRN
jgi:iron complex outermembrane receptor protein